MLDSTRNLRTSQMLLRQWLPPVEREWLLSHLCSRRDITRAEYAHDSCRLTVEYDADEMRSSDLNDVLNECGIQVALARWALSDSSGLRPATHSERVGAHPCDGHSELRSVAEPPGSA